uniref:ribonuclease H n=1 Tax=Sinocyclocheilus rhinocerous TaxID=307959 RepID=A0A673H911_9TELE
MISVTYPNKSSVLPFLELKIDSKPYVFLLDTGASRSSLSGKVYEGSITGKTINSVGISGVPVRCEMTPTLPVTSKDNPSLFKMHAFAIIPDAPFCLLGRDLLHKLGAHITFQNNSLQLMFPSVYSLTVETGSATTEAEVATAALPELIDVNPCLWAEHKDDAGLIDVRPYAATLTRHTPVYCKQYPLSKEKIDGIRPIIENLLAQGILIKTHSPYNTPINPIRKANGSWRLTQDLRKINDIIKPLAPIVPDVHTILNSIPSSHAYFTVIDLCSAFFSIPVDPVSQPLFAFTFDHAQLSWTRLPQGLRDSPAVFAAVVHATLADAQLPPDTCLLQYADDILVTGASADQCAAASSIVCNILAEAGFKASREKLQWVQRRVDYLGHELSQDLLIDDLYSPECQWRSGQLQ